MWIKQQKYFSFCIVNVKIVHYTFFSIRLQEHSVSFMHLYVVLLLFFSWTQKLNLYVICVHRYAKCESYVLKYKFRAGGGVGGSEWEWEIECYFRKKERENENYGFIYLSCVYIYTHKTTSTTNHHKESERENGREMRMKRERKREIECEFVENE
jgi:hypothetical protein